VNVNQLKDRYDTIIIGAGAAGVFAANCLTSDEASNHEVLVIEKNNKALTKVAVSGGGRCNVTNGCFDIAKLIKNYPRGSKELRGPFHTFSPPDVIEWFSKRGVELKQEEDGRIFPVTDNSQTIIDCLMKGAQRDYTLAYRCKIETVQKKDDGEFVIILKDGGEIRAKNVLITTGSSKEFLSLLKDMGHKIVDPVPSLFTFNIPDHPLVDLSGVCVQKTKVSLPQFKMEMEGPTLITHWGFSGPAILKLSSWAAKELHAASYHVKCLIDWVPEFSEEGIREEILKKTQGRQTKSIFNDSLNIIPKQLWKAFLKEIGIGDKMVWQNLSKKFRDALVLKLKKDVYQVSGKTTHKQEFVTCGGIKLSEVNFKKMESKVVPGLYFAGEVLDIDGVTGGFNFQAAWTTAFVAASAMG
jgi:predicted Rossmann fold flavoprotein